MLYEVSEYQEGAGSMAGFATSVGEGQGAAESQIHRGLQLQQQPHRR